MLIKFCLMIALLINPISSQEVTTFFTDNLQKLSNESLSLECNNLQDTVAFDKKILKFKACSIAKVLSDVQLVNTINNSSNTFVLFFELEWKFFNFTPHEMSKMEKNLKNLNRKVLVVIYSIKETRESLFIFNKRQLIPIDVSDNADKPSMSSFLSEFIEMQLNATVSNTSLLTFAFQSNCDICMRIVYLISPEYKDESMLSGKCDVDCIRAYLQVPFAFEFIKKIDKVEKMIDSYVEELKAIYIEDSNENFTREKRYEYEDLTSFVWNQKIYKVFYFLITSDLPYPNNFVNDMTNLNNHQVKNRFIKKINSYNDTIENFHTDIRSNNIQNIREFLSTNPKLRFARNMENKSALQIAFESENWEVYSILKAHGMFFGSFEEILAQRERIGTINEEEKKRIRQFNYQNLEAYSDDSEDDYIEVLVRKTLLNFDVKKFTKQFLFNEVSVAYKELDLTFNSILHLASKSPDLEVIFDFESTDTSNVDPSTNDSLAYADNDNHKILIGAKDLLSANRTKRNSALGSVIHEFTHYATFLIYDHDSIPYRRDDKESRELFSNITSKCRQLKKSEEIISAAFAYKDSDGNGDELIQSELIARVPDMIATYKDETTKIDKLKKTYKFLFEYYEGKVLDDIKSSILNMEVIAKIRNYNEMLGVISDIRSLPYEFKNSKIESFSNDRFVLFYTNFDTLLLKQIESNLHDYAVFMQMSYCSHDNFHSTFLAIDNIKTENLTLVIQSDVGDYFSSLYTILKESRFKKIIIVASVNQENFFEEFKFAEMTFNFKPSDLTAESQTKFLNTSINFQGVEIHLCDLIDNSPKLADHLAMGEIYNAGDKTFGVHLDANEEHLVERKLLDSNGYEWEIHEVVEKIFNPDGQKYFQVKSSKKSAKKQLADESKLIFLLSDKPGSGKTTAMKELAIKIKQSNPSKLVLFIDLKEQIEFFKEFQAEKKTWDDSNILQFFSKSSISAIEEYKVALLFDAFDEISPDYNEIVLDLIRFCQKSIDVIWVASRSHLEEDLAANLRLSVFKLKELTEKEDQLAFLEYYDEDRESNVMKIVNDIGGVGNVQMIKDIADYSGGENLYLIYRHLITLRIIQMRLKGDLVVRDLSEGLLTGFKEIHQRLALSVTFDIINLDIVRMRNNSLTEGVFRFGLVDGSTKTFIHKSFAEFFIAEYFIDNLLRFDINANEYEKILKFYTENVKNKRVIEKFVKNFIEAESHEILAEKLVKFTESLNN